jgi:phosphoserine phosphatase
MARTLYPQSTIAIIWDFDRTLIPGYMQKPLFDHFGVEGAQFWREVEALPEFYRRRGHDLISPDSLYLHHILTYVKQGIFGGLNNKLLRELGSQIQFYPGLPDFFAQVQKRVEMTPGEHFIHVEHYIVSGGLRQMILGSAIADYAEDVWASEFAEQDALPGFLDDRKQQPLFEDDAELTHILYTIDNTSKTRALFEINKGTNKNRNVDVNAKVPHEDRRIPFQNMIYVADGPSDVPMFAVVKQNGGKAYGVYRAESEAEFEQVNRLQEQGRIDSFGEANYEENSQTYMWIMHAVDRIAGRIVKDREAALHSSMGEPPSHLGD